MYRKHWLQPFAHNSQTQMDIVTHRSDVSGLRIMAFDQISSNASINFSGDAKEFFLKNIPIKKPFPVLPDGKRKKTGLFSSSYLPGNSFFLTRS